MFVVVLACLAFFSLALPDSMLGVSWPSMRIDFGESVSAAGLVPPVGIAANLVSTILTGRLVARLGVGRLLTAGAVLSTISLLVGGLSPTFRMFLVSVVLAGLSAGATDTSLNAYAARRFGARKINLLHASYGVGAVVSPLIVTAVLQFHLTWRWAYLIVAMLQAGLSIIFLTTRRSWARPVDVDHSRADRNAPAWSRPVMINTGIGLLAVGVQTGIESSAALWSYVFLTGAAGVRPGVAGVVASGYWATMVVGRLLLGSLAERIGAWRVLGLSVGGLLVAAALVLVSSPATAIMGIVCFGLAAAPAYPLLILTTAERTSIRVVDQVVGLQAAASSVGAALIPPAVGLLMGRSLHLFAPAIAVLSACALGLQIVVRIRRTAAH
ncbi:MFS transporter [Microlunatus endophyticus]|uniref:MFS transporter n=1 Tax=Microlunatus endophyticus TaxID=1716077 RepID=A0A917W8H6_9ACTN|nr:MFS transporter [Microlunatus endophyticus]GGL83062.1 MFS transporter [Microlunatus endophyticus]